MDHALGNLTNNIWSIKNVKVALAGVAQWIECWPANQMVTDSMQFPVRAHEWAAGHVPNSRGARGNHTLMFLSLSVCLPSPL